ncbi:hypothetical protein [Methylorubrum extorquens]|uniref:hypothetical protein n=1 Tax=Methylorubrum extorquens TaxID=408 RepID=UPI002237F62F|nr:hypothetical protein [Methylorubrum extorquens]UYW33676.1 hypothetical protein OKB92_06220 [Methylorubrum extorquens]
MRETHAVTQTALNERDGRILVLFAKMESARIARRTVRLSWKDTDLLWTVFGGLMGPAATWAFGPIDEDASPQPDLGALLVEIGRATVAQREASHGE